MNQPHSALDSPTDDPMAAVAPESLREGIENTRAEIAATIGALETKLGPSELKEKLDVEVHHLETKVRELSHELLGEARVLVKEELAEASTLLRHELREAEGKIRIGLSDAREVVIEDLQKAITRAKQSARAATLGKVEDLATSAGDVMNETRDTLIETIRQNPIPAALAGVGLAWLLMNRSTSASRHRGYQSHSAPSSGPRAPAKYDSAGRSLLGSARHGSEEMASVAHRASDAVSHAAHGVAHTANDALAHLGEAAHHVSESAGSALHGAVSAAGNVSGHAAHAASQLAHDASDIASTALDGAWSQARRVERGFESTLRDNPLAVGAAVLVAGAALGYALPRTKPEDALMGQSRDRFIHRAEALVQNAAEAVGHVTEQTGDAAKHALESAVGS
jgi:hypothetical protein